MSTQCITCEDSHRMWRASAERYVPCTQCRIPCRDCAADEGRGAYCAIADCTCECHHWLGANERSRPAPEPSARDELVALLKRWRDLDADPQAYSTADDNVHDHESWRQTYAALAADTDRVLVAEKRRPT